MDGCIGRDPGTKGFPFLMSIFIIGIIGSIIGFHDTTDDMGQDTPDDMGGRREKGRREKGEEGMALLGR